MSIFIALALQGANPIRRPPEDVLAEYPRRLNPKGD